ncbi:hypothetical protein HJC23_012193 [Cyclotella cryptica]|uniref:Methyltransferase type 11 domain-containing protein n=1 Tax=Cyclotella cryptica TaxID=29204 RepID=A0ABD3PTY5_9STRA|eukprot:CCRYP_011223-RA/>CCRYP_011223-RA protein AED:0.33 eAED:0.33 QI:211/1/1/1/0.66/0.5/4/662/592
MMHPLPRHRLISTLVLPPILLIFFSLQYVVIITNAATSDATDFLLKADSAMYNNRLEEAIELYSRGIQFLPKPWSTQQYHDFADFQDIHSDEGVPPPKEMEMILSLHTNYATALSLMEGSTDNVLNGYRTACILYRKWKRSAREQDKEDMAPKKVAVQSFFFLGMTYQDLASAVTSSVDRAENRHREKQEEYLQHAVKVYAAATKLDPNHWSSFANMGVVLADVGLDGDGNNAASLQLFEEGIMSYQKAIEILIGSIGYDGSSKKDARPTDPPENVDEVVAELHYRIGLCLVPFLFTGTDKSEQDYGKKLCTLPDVASGRSCMELSAYQFHTALRFHPRHEGALNALALVTADATFGMSTDVKNVQQLFEEYASSFENSLVDQLNYNGFHRMRRRFDHVMLKEKGENHKFQLVVDAGCGTGLAGEVFRNISDTLIGVDISPKIIEQAKQSHPVYDDYRIGDIRQVLQQFPQNVSLLVAADSFIYFNDLSDLFVAMKSAIEEGGYAVFSLENVSADSEQRLTVHRPSWRWQITPSGRIAHRKDYVESIAGKQSFRVILYEKLDGFRKENGVGVPGHFFVMKKSSDTLASNDEL